MIGDQHRRRELMPSSRCAEAQLSHGPRYDQHGTHSFLMDAACPREASGAQSKFYAALARDYAGRLTVTLVALCQVVKTLNPPNPYESCTSLARGLIDGPCYRAATDARVCHRARRELQPGRRGPQGI